MSTSKQILKDGNGTCYGVSNDLAQESKMLRIYDGTTLLGIFSLDRAFPPREVTYTENGESVTGFEPGIVLNMLFTKNLWVETDGDGLTFEWQ